MSGFRLTDAQVEQFQQDGYIQIESLFDTDEIELLRKVSKADSVLEDQSAGRRDGQGGVTKLTLWNRPGDDVYGMFARCHRVVDSAEQLLDGEVYHYHSKMTMKEPYVGGAWAWHQDYGYWYNNGCLFPHMLSVMIPVDRASKENGCLQVLKGSHLMGRIDHVQVGDQTGADPERVEQAAKVLDLVYCQMEPGDALFFHCNLLHRSDQNASPNPRWTLICCYNAARNNPYEEHHHPRYEPLVKVPDTAIKELGAKQFSSDRAFWHPSHEEKPPGPK